MDGEYVLTIDATKVTHFGVGLDGNADGVGGDDHLFGAIEADKFYRKYGDYDPNGIVDLLDFAAFRKAFGSGSEGPTYQEGFDADGDKIIGLLDFSNFRRNFGT